MIKTNRGNTKMKGAVTELLADYAVITRNMVKMLMENGIDREKALEMVTDVHCNGKLTEEELKEKFNKEIQNTLFKLLDKLGEKAEEKADEERA